MGQFKSYLVKDISPTIWQRVRIRAMREGITIRALFLRWIQQYAEGK